MTPPDSAEDLATIVASGASRPVRKWIFITLAVALLGAGVWYYFNRDGNGEEKTAYQTQEAKTGRISLIVTAAGNLAPTNQIIVGSELSGTAKEVLVDTNDPVKKGQTLAQLDTSKLDQQTERSRASLLAAKASVSQAEATVAESKAALARRRNSTSSAAGKPPRAPPWKPRRATLARAQADLESAKAAVDRCGGGRPRLRERPRENRHPLAGRWHRARALHRSRPDRRRLVHRSHAFHHRRGSEKNGTPRQCLRSGHRPHRNRPDRDFSVDAWPSRNYTAKVKKVAFGAVGTGTTAKEGPPRPTTWSPTAPSWRSPTRTSASAPA